MLTKHDLNSDCRDRLDCWLSCFEEAAIEALDHAGVQLTPQTIDTVLMAHLHDCEFGSDVAERVME